MTGLDGSIQHSGGDAEPASATDAEMPSTPAAVNVGLEIVRDLVKAFQNHLDARRWRSVRFSLHLFAHLASLPKPLVDAGSLLNLLRDSFVSALENEPGLRAERGDELVRVVLETLIRLSADRGLDADALEGIKAGIAGYMTSRQLDTAFLASGTGNEGQWVDVSAYFSSGKLPLLAILTIPPITANQRALPGFPIFYLNAPAIASAAL